MWKDVKQINIFMFKFNFKATSKQLNLIQEVLIYGIAIYLIWEAYN